MSGTKKIRVFLLLAAAIAVPLIAPWLGVQTIMPADLFSGGSQLDAKIFWQLRIPRVIMAWCAGATFGICGMVFQALFRNPLAEPSLLGISSGAALGAATVIRFGAVALAGAIAIPTGAFFGSMLTVMLISTFAKMVRSSKDATLLLAGIAISSLFSSMIMVFQYTGGSVETYKLLSWTMGGISVVGLGEGMRALPSLAIVLALALHYSTELDLITFGDEIAVTRGVRLERTRRILFVGMSLSLAIVVANCGPIAFLGLIAPHVARGVAGPKHFRLTFLSAVVGGTALLLSDTLARTLWAPADLPVGIIVSFLGAPFFLWLLIRPDAGCSARGK